MKFSKKALALLLSAMMVQSIVVTTAVSVSADEETSPSESITEISEDPEFPDDSEFPDDPVISEDVQQFEDWYYMEAGDRVAVIQYVGDAETVEIPSEINGKSVVYIEDGAFKFNRTMKNVVIPSDVIAIGNGAFRGCSALRYIEGGQEIMTIGNRAFEGCLSLTNFPLMFNLTAVGVAAFKDCFQLCDVTLYQVEEIAPYAFAGCKNLAYITSIETARVGKFAFYGCKNLTNATIVAGQNVDKVLLIEPMAFGRCTSLKIVDFHWADRVNVKPYAFYNCKSINSVRYAGSYERWEENVKIAVLGNFYLNKAEKYCSDMNVAELDETEMAMQTGETVQLTYHSAPYVGQEEELNVVSWMSSNPEVATVDENGNVVAKSAGVTQIVLISSSESYPVYDSYCMITVTQAADSVELNKTAVNVGVGQQYALKATVSPSDAPQEVVWSTSDRKLAVVDENGVITAKKAGTVTITATTSNGKTATCKVNVKKAPESITLDKEELTLNVNSSYTLQKTLSANSATSFKWTSSDPEVARVYSTGKVVAQKSGTTTITVTTHNGLTASCVVTVK